MQALPCGSRSSAAFEERLHRRGDGAGLREGRDVLQLVGRADLAAGDHVLDVGHDDRDHREGDGRAGHLADHPHLDHLRLDLAEAGDRAR